MITDKPMEIAAGYPYVPDAVFDSEREAMAYLDRWTQIVGQHVMCNANPIKVTFTDRPSRGTVGKLSFKRNRVTGEVTILGISYNRYFIRANLRNPVFWRHMVAHECAHLKYQSHDFLWEMTMLHYCSRADANDSIIIHTDIPKKAPRYVCRCPCGKEYTRQTAPRMGATYKCPYCNTRGLTFRPA